MSERLSRERLEEIAARAEAASYDHEHDCDQYEYAQEDGRCYHHESGELCRYEPKCHDNAIRHSLKPRLVPDGRLATDVPALLAHIAALEAETGRLRATLAAKERVQRTNEAEMGAEIERLWAVVTDLGDLMSESYGVAGLHKNGDLASWESLRAGGQFESWLQSYDTALGAQEATDEPR